MATTRPPQPRRPPLDPAALATAMQHDKPDAARQLARLSRVQLARQAVAYAAFLSDTYSFGDRPRIVESATVFLDFLDGIATYARSRQPPEEEHDARHDH